jgi:hypothetical protein
LTQAQDSLIDILLKFHRVVKGALPVKSVLVFPGQNLLVHEPLERASGFVIDPGFFGASPGFAFEFLRGHEEVQEGNRRPVDGGQEGLFLKAREPVITGVLADHGAVFLFDEAVVVFLVVAAAGEGDKFVFAPDFGGAVDEFTAVVAVELQNRKREGMNEVREGLEGPGMGLVEEGIETNPAGGGIGGGQGEEVLARSGVGLKSAGVDLPETGLFSFPA